MSIINDSCSHLQFAIQISDWSLGWWQKYLSHDVSFENVSFENVSFKNVSYENVSYNLNHILDKSIQLTLSTFQKHVLRHSIFDIGLRYSLFPNRILDFDIQHSLFPNHILDFKILHSTWDIYFYQAISVTSTFDIRHSIFPNDILDFDIRHSVFFFVTCHLS